jgi:pimeloyl-ACP methyl ester carboxylesterase
MDVEAVCRTIFDEVWNRDNYAAVRHWARGQWVMDDWQEPPTRPGLYALLDLINAYKAFVPDLSFRITRQIREARTVATFWSARGQHTGLMSSVPSTGMAVSLSGAASVEVSRRGGIERLSGVWDVGSFMRQTGVSDEQLRGLLRLPDSEIPMRVVSEVDATPIVLFPTLSLPGWLTWRRFTETLKCRAPVATFQFIGNRLAFVGADSTGYSVRRESDAVKRGLDRAALKGPFHIVGHSAGGTIALRFALDWPDAVKSLTLVEPGSAWILEATGRIDEKIARFLTSRLRTYRRRATPARYAAFLKKSYGDPNYEPLKSPFWPLFCAYRGNLQFRTALLTHRDDLVRLRCLRVPVLLVRGKDSDCFHRRVVDTLSEILPDVRVAELPGGHVPHGGPGAEPFLNLLATFQHAADDLTVSRQSAGEPIDARRDWEQAGDSGHTGSLHS